jgi:soluble P-type ATPase
VTALLSPAPTSVTSSSIKIHPLHGWTEDFLHPSKSKKTPTLRLEGKELQTFTGETHRREFIDRCFSLPTLSSLEVSRNGRVTLYFFEKTKLSDTLRELGAAMRQSASVAPLAKGEEVLSLVGNKSWQIYRVGSHLSFWRIDEINEDQFRCFHPLIKESHFRDLILDEITTLAGVEVTRTDRHGIVLTRDLHCKVTSLCLLETLETAIAKGLHNLPEVSIARNSHEALVNAHFAVSPISDYLFPPARFLNAIFLPFLNFHHGKKAFHELKRGVFSLNALHTVMGSLGFVTLHFFGDALMGWCSHHWPKLSTRLLRKRQREFLARFRRYPRSVWIGMKGGQKEVRLVDVQPGDLIVLREGDIVPGDGVVHSGEGFTEEGWITGHKDAVAKTSGDAVFASSVVVRGELKMTLRAIGPDTVAAQLAEWYKLAFERRDPSVAAKEFADSSAFPNFVVLLAGIFRGGVHMGKAAAHADYHTGPVIAAQMANSGTMMQCAGVGAMISTPAILPDLGYADCFIIDDSAADWQADSNSSQTIGDQLRKLGVKEIVLVSHRPSEKISALAKQIGVDVHFGGQTTSDKIELIRQRQLFGNKVVYMGDAESGAPLVEVADVSMVVGNGADLPEADVILLQPDLEKAVLLKSAGTRNMGNDRTNINTSLVFNFTCTVGALFFSLPILGVAALTNLGIFINYRRAAQSLR